MGLSFSVPRGVHVPPRVMNMLKEARAWPSPHGDLTSWTEQGVLLLNTVLTVLEGKPLSHKNLGWERFTDAAIRTLSRERTGVVFLLWGEAKEKAKLVDTSRHTVLSAGHPSPLTYEKHFKGCNHFQKVNELFASRGEAEINWQLPQSVQVVLHMFAPLRHEEDSNPSLALVEVRKGEASAARWYDAVLKDINSDRAVISFEGGVWPGREVPCDSVRPRPPREVAGAQVAFQPGNAVEVRFAASEQSPASWALGHVADSALSREGHIAVIVESQKSASKAQDVLVSLDAVRPVSRQPALDPLFLARRAVPIDEDLHGWLSTPDARGCLEQVRSVTGLSLAVPGVVAPGLAPLRNDESKLDSVVLLGNSAAATKAEMLLKIHLMHQREVEAFHKRRSRKLAILEDLTYKASGAGARASFEVDASLVGRTCGKGGDRIQKVEKDFGVEVRIVDGADESAPRTVLISGDSDEAAAKARQELELVKQLFEVQEDRVEWVLGKDNRTIQDMQKKAGLAYATWTGSELELCGQRTCVDDAVLLLESHMEYFFVYQEMDRQQDEIQQSFEALEKAAEAAGLAPQQRSAEKGGKATAPKKDRATSAGRSSSAGRAKGRDDADGKGAGQKGGGQAGGRGQGARGRGSGRGAGSGRRDVPAGQAQAA
ncbi:unnamed protein product [Polarella glacialis]|uniref:Uracil-DNA glycosylase n=1 Tax=Polarella glacialis TaxID=89957 RepID=A0A813H956_POLGL|nr:unnamed protein product [Polarella glacialis]